MPARIASGSLGQASMSAAKAGSMLGFVGVSAPDFAPPWAENMGFSREFAVGSIPIHSRDQASMRPRPEDRGELVASTLPWKVNELQCGHGPKTVEKRSQVGRDLSTLG